MVSFRHDLSNSRSQSMKTTFRISDRTPNQPRAQRQPFQQLGRFETQHNFLRSIPSTSPEWIQKFFSSLFFDE
eukprot:m.466865 g.466865  ORF g.466865 m.466865 type:complete len:73 (+) comp57062_c0_seq26:491-709(+)